MSSVTLYDPRLVPFERRGWIPLATAPIEERNKPVKFN